MKPTLLSIFGLATISVPAQSALIYNGDFQMYKPGTGYTVTATFSGANPFARGVGDGIDAAGGTVTYSDGSPDGVANDGTADIDLPGWTTVQGGNDLVPNGVGSSTALNIFAAWGGDGRVQTAGSLGIVGAGNSYTISVMVDGPNDGPISQPLAFHLLADGVQLNPSAVVDPILPGNGFQEISRTYDAASIAGHEGASLSIVLGVEDANDAGNRVIFDNVSLTVVPEPATGLLLGAGWVLASLRRRRK